MSSAPGGILASLLRWEVDRAKGPVISDCCGWKKGVAATDCLVLGHTPLIAVTFLHLGFGLL